MVASSHATNHLNPQPKATSEHSFDKRIGYLDGWRGVSILIVLLGHFGNRWIPESVSLIGVDLFFVLSGRLMCEILFERRAQLPTFFVRRFSRVYPALFCFVLLAAALFAKTSIAVGYLGILSALTFTINYAMIYFHHTGVFDQLWSLCVEEHAYILLGFLAFLSRRAKRNATWLILLLGFAAMANGLVQSMLFGKSYFAVYWRSDVMIAPIFLAGGWFLVLRRQSDRLRRIIFAASLVLAVASKYVFYGTPIAFALWIGFIAMAVATIDHAPKLLQQVLEVAPLRQIGIWSYSLYLWQQPFYKLSEQLPVPLMLAAAIVCGLLSFYIIERPARAFINHHATGLVRRLQPREAT